MIIIKILLLALNFICAVWMYEEKHYVISAINVLGFFFMLFSIITDLI